MTRKKFASDMIKKALVNNDGETIGTIVNFVVDTVTGSIKSVLVKPSGPDRYTDFPTDKEGRYMIPLPRIKPFRDVYVADVRKKGEIQKA